MAKSNLLAVLNQEFGSGMYLGAQSRTIEAVLLRSRHARDGCFGLVGEKNCVSIITVKTDIEFVTEPFDFCRQILMKEFCVLGDML